MNLAALLGICLICLKWIPPACAEPPTHEFSEQPFSGQSATVQLADVGSTTPRSQDSAPAPKQQAATAAPQSSPASDPSRNTSPRKKPRAKLRPKELAQPDCPTSSPPLGPAVGNSSDSTNPNANKSKPEGSESKPAPSGNEAPAVPNPCPPSKKVIPNGGSKEPDVQLKGGTEAEQASHQRSTEELNAAIAENLKKIEGRHLNASQQEMVTQVKRFMEQSKTAIAAGDAERGHNLALKARLLSDELLKP